jgi:hypothetical protein
MSFIYTPDPTIQYEAKDPKLWKEFSGEIHLTNWKLYLHERRKTLGFSLKRGEIELVLDPIMNEEGSFVSHWNLSVAYKDGSKHAITSGSVTEKKQSSNVYPKPDENAEKMKSFWGGKGAKKSTKSSSGEYKKTANKHTNNKGVTRTVYTKDGASYVRVKSAKTGKFTYRKVK